MANKKRMSKHGYEINELTFDRAVYETVDQEGIEKALKIHPHDKVVHQIGGKAYGAKITDTEVTTVTHLENSLSAGWGSLKEVVDIADTMEFIKFNFVLTPHKLLIQETTLRPCLKLIKWHQLMKKNKKYHKDDAELDAETYLTLSDKKLIKDVLKGLNISVKDVYRDFVKYKKIKDVLKRKGFIDPFIPPE